MIGILRKPRSRMLLSKIHTFVTEHRTRSRGNLPKARSFGEAPDPLTCRPISSGTSEASFTSDNYGYLQSTEYGVQTNRQTRYRACKGIEAMNRPSRSVPTLTPLTSSGRLTLETRTLKWDVIDATISETNNCLAWPVSLTSREASLVGPARLLGRKVTRPLPVSRPWSAESTRHIPPPKESDWR